MLRSRASIVTSPAVLAPGIGVVLACWCVQQLPQLPAPEVPRVCIGMGGVLWALLALAGARVARIPGGRTLLRWGPCAAAALLAAGWALVCARDALDARIDPASEARAMQVVGVVTDLPQQTARGVRFAFRIETCADTSRRCPAGHIVRLAWAARPGTAAPEPGQRWALELRLRPIHALINPGLFDAELRALEDGLAATGTVAMGKGARPPELLEPFVGEPITVVAWCRSRLRTAMQAALPPEAGIAGGVLVALAVGDQAAIPADWWSRFNRTGVGHLMSISGLHITMLAALGGGVAGRLWSSRWLAARMRRPLPVRVPTPRIRWAAGLVFGFAYAALAGWGIPAQRTCWMLAAAGLALLCGRGRSPVAVLSTAAAVVCVLDPWAPLAAGFWLSFAAVGAIIWHGTRRASEPADTGLSRVDRARRVLREALRSQVAATVSLLPLGALFFSSVSLVSPVANAFAIPIVSAVVTPLALAGAALAPLSTALASVPLTLGVWITEGLLVVLQWLDLGSTVAPAVAVPQTLPLALAVAGCVVLLAPVPLPVRGLALLAFAPMLMAIAPRPDANELWLTALDIGQGTAVLVETAEGRLLYDAGPTLGTDNDAGARVIAPFLRARGIDALEALVVSHEDTDHAGGALSVLREIRVGWVASSLPQAHPVIAAAARHYRCRQGEVWQWGRVRFEWLHPADDDPVARRSPTNARSCVLRISSPAGSALLAGDIEAAQERRLLEKFSVQKMAADLLLAPHHGSRTSSTEAFLDAVQPKLAVFQMGYRNRYRHPNPIVLQRYVDRGIGILRSDAHGAVIVRMRNGRAPEVWRTRIDAPRYWRVRLQALEGDPEPPIGKEAARDPD